MKPNYSKTVAGAVIAGVLFLLFVHGFRSGFQRSTEWWPVSIAVTIAIAVVPAAWMMRISLKRGPSSMPLRSAGFFSLAVVFAMMLVFATLFLYPIVANVFADHYTANSGTPFEDRNVPFSTYETTSLRDCHYQVRGPYFARGSSRGYYCAGEEELEALKSAELARVVGVESWFGRRIYHVEPERAAR